MPARCEKSGAVTFASYRLHKIEQTTGTKYCVSIVLRADSDKVSSRRLYSSVALKTLRVLIKCSKSARSAQRKASGFRVSEGRPVGNTADKGFTGADPDIEERGGGGAYILSGDWCGARSTQLSVRPRV